MRNEACLSTHEIVPACRREVDYQLSCVAFSKLDSLCGEREEQMGAVMPRWVFHFEVTAVSDVLKRHVQGPQPALRSV